MWQTPPVDLQVSNGIDIDDCAEETLCHVIYGLKSKRYSPRALASEMFKRGLLTDNGSSIDDCIAVANEVGLIPYDLWPTPPTFTKAEYLAPVPTEIQVQADKLKIQKIDPNLNKSPLITLISFPHPAGSVLHFVDQINDTQYFDSEPGNPIKPLNYEGAVVLSQHSIKLGDSMKLVNDNGTVFLLGPAGKLGIADDVTLAKFKQIEPDIEIGSTADIPQIGTATHNDAIIIHN